MPKILISFLGKVSKTSGGNYASTVYVVEDSRYETTFFASALARHHAVDRLRILGTAGSMWDVLSVELEPHSIDSPAWDALEKAVGEDAVSQEHLDAVAVLLNRPGRPHYELRLIPYGTDDREQVDTLRMMAEGFTKQDSLLLDVTHGLRHLPMLGLMSAFYIQAVVGAKVSGMYYAAYDRKENGATPVVRLSGLLRLYEWVRALECFNKDGDYSVFGSLLQTDGLRGELLAEAGYLERVAVAPDAKRKLDSFMQMDPMEPRSPAGKLFLPLLRERIDWRQGRDRAAWEGRLARKYLERRDYLRAVQFAFESLISRRVIENGSDPNDYDTARQTAEGDLEQKTKEERIDPERSENFITLKYLRNALSHGLRAKVEAGNNMTQKTARLVDKMLQNEAKLYEWLEKAFQHLPR